METISKLFLELSQLVGEECKTEREISLEREVERLKKEAYKEASEKFGAVVTAQSHVLDLIKWIARDHREEFETRYGSGGLELLDVALKETGIKP